MLEDSPGSEMSAGEEVSVMLVTNDVDRSLR